MTIKSLTSTPTLSLGLALRLTLLVGFVDYTSVGGTSRRNDNYGSTHGSYLLPIYNDQGIILNLES